MSTVSKEIADKLVAGEYGADYEGATKIIAYDNAFGGVGYGVVYEHNDQDRYDESEFIRNPRVYWERPA